MTVRESRVWEEGLPHPANTIDKPHRIPEHTRGRWRIRMRRLVKEEN